MPYNIFAECEIGRIVSRRGQRQPAVRQAREYRRRGYTDISILDLDTGTTYDVRTLAATLPPARPVQTP